LRKSVSLVLAAVTTAASVTAGAIAVTGSEPSAVAATGDGIQVRTVRYGSHDRQVMDVYTPASAVGRTGLNRGTFLLIHGGSWVRGDKDGPEPQARQLARRGYVAVSMNYRYATQAAWPAQRNDGLSAVKYLRSHARGLNVDPGRIVLIGWSAGAHIATAVATYGRGGDLVHGAIGLSGPLGMWRTAADPAGGLDGIVKDLLLRCAPAICPDRYDSATPRKNLSKGDPPILLFSARHEWVDPQHSVDFIRTARAKGLRAWMEWIPGSQHAGYWDEAWPEIRDWISRRMAAR
jgi:acetyl esterase/lipase